MKYVILSDFTDPNTNTLCPACTIVDWNGAQVTAMLAAGCTMAHEHAGMVETAANHPPYVEEPILDL